MKQKIHAQLKSKYAGVHQEILSGVADYLAATVTDESTIEEAVNGVAHMVSAMQSENDRRVNQFKSENEALKDQLKKAGTGKGENEDGKGKDEAPAWAQSLIDANKKLTDEVSQLKSGNIAKQHSELLVAKLKELNVSDKYFAPAIAGRSFKDEQEVETFAGTLANSYKEYQQELADSGLGEAASSRPVFGQSNKDGISQSVAEYIANKTSDKKDSPMGGKKIE
jgi:hypothetical protein